MSDHRGFSHQLAGIILFSGLTFLGGCEKEDASPVTSTQSSASLPADPALDAVVREMTQVDAERRALNQALDPASATPKGSGACGCPPAPTEEDMRQAGEWIRGEYQSLGRMPTRSEMVALLVSKMTLGATPHDRSTKAHHILDMMMLD